jgi:hypothetical protein
MKEITYSVGLNIEAIDLKESKIGYAVRVEGKWKTVDYSTFMITLTRDLFPIILEGNKFLFIQERTEDGKFVPTTDEELLKFIINETESTTHTV